MISEQSTLVRISVLTFTRLLQISQKWVIASDRIAKGLLLESKISRPSELFQLKIKKQITMNEAKFMHSLGEGKLQSFSLYCGKFMNK